MVTLNGETTSIVHPIEGSRVRWNPFEELTEMRQRMDDWFNREFAYTPLARMIPNEPYTFEPIVDCIPTETALEVFVPVPGFTPEGIKVEVLPMHLLINGERPPLYAIEPTVKNVPYWGAVTATFAIDYRLPMEVNPDEVQATLNNGVLHLVLPIAEKARPHFVTVKAVPEKYLPY
jgi:HSP20 family protein